MYHKLIEFKQTNANILTSNEKRILHKFSVKILFHMELGKKLPSQTQIEEEIDSEYSQNGGMINEEPENIYEEDIIRRTFKVIDNWYGISILP